MLKGKHCLLFVFISCFFGIQAHGRIWTNHDNKQFDGELIQADRDNAVIQRKSDLRKFTVPIVSLSPGDRNYIREFGKRLAKYNQGVKALQKTFPKVMEAPLFKSQTKYKLFERFTSSSGYRYGELIKKITVERENVYARYKVYFDHIPIGDLKGHLDHIRKKLDGDIVSFKKTAKGTGYVAAQKRLNLVWIEKELLPHIKQWDDLADSFY